MVSLLAFSTMCNAAFIALFFVGLGFLVPEGICFGIAYRWYRDERKLRDTVELVRVYRRIPISKLARKMGIAEAEAERRVIRCHEYNLFHGYIDRRTEKAFSMEGMLQERKITRCTQCGTPIDKIALVGEELRCSACDSIL